MVGGVQVVPGCDQDGDALVGGECEQVRELTRGGATIRDKDGGGERPLSARDVLVVALMNRHVAAIQRALSGFAPEIAVGTVDRFQGREAPVVVYAMGVSSLSLAARGAEFLLSANRFNVAVSRAMARAILVASPSLFEELPGQVGGLRLMNAYVRFVEEGSV